MSQHQKNNNEEIDLGDLFRLLKKGVQYILNLFLRFVAFILKHAIVLAVLIIIGAIAGYFLQNNSVKRVKTEMIIAADYGSAEYLYKSVEEVKYKLRTENVDLFNKLGFKDEDSVPPLTIEVTPIFNIEEFPSDKERFYNLLNESNVVSEEAKKDLIQQISRFYRITLTHPKEADSRFILENLLQVIRNNDYYQKVYEFQAKKNEFLINSNEFLISHIDSLIQNYSQKANNGLAASNSITSNELDLGELIGNRSNLLEELDLLYDKKVANEQLFKLVDLGYPTTLENKGITSHKIILIPLLLVLGYFGLIIFVKVVQKARKLD